MKNRMLVACIAFVMLLLPLTGGAQSTTSRMDGLVKDASGGVVPAATVTLISQETQFSDSRVTNENGLFIFPQVPPGNYQIKVEKSGFKTASVTDIKVDVGIPRSVDVKLEIGSLTESIEVTADLAGSLINVVNAELNTVVDRTQIQSLPISGRSPLELALMQAGVTSRGEIARESSVNGMRGTYQNLTLDGINNQDNFIRTDAFFGVLPVKESFVEEFSITTSNSDVDGGLGASQTKLVTRSGTSKYHVEAFYYNRNTALNANSFFNNAAGVPRESDKNHQYGFNVGGPIAKEKLFFFVDWEEERNPASVSVVRTVLSSQARNGSFTYRRSDNGALETVNLLTMTGVASDPAIVSLLAKAPTPNDTSVGDGTNTGGYRFNSLAKSTNKWLTFRIDYNPLKNHYISAVLHQFRYSLPNDPFNASDSPFPGLPGSGQKSTRYLGSLSLRSTLRSTMTNEFHFGAQYAPVDFVTNEKFALGYQLTIPLVDNPVQNQMGQGRNAPVYELADPYSWTKGDHFFKFGGGVRWTSVDSDDEAGILPNYTLAFGFGNLDPLSASLFPGGIDDFTTASNQLALLGGFVDSATQTFNVRNRTSGFVDGYKQSRKFSQRFFDLYASDNWRIKDRLALTLGLRWEYHGIPNETQGLALLPVNGVNDLLNADAVLDFAGRGTGHDFYKGDYNNFAPSVSIAWSPFKKRSSVIRAGYSINYVNDNNFTSVLNASSNNDGLSQTVSAFDISGTVSGVGLVPITAPTFMVPRTIRQNIEIDPGAAIYAIDQNLRTPYVQQWNLSLQHEIFKDMALEVRYVGNHGVKLARAIDVNQLMLPGEFVADWRRARRNLLSNGDPYAGEALTVIPQLGLGGYLDNVSNLLLTNEIGDYIGGLLAPNRSYFFAGEGGENFGSTIPITYFYRNPNAFVSDYLGNLSYSNYHALQVELRRRFSKGFAFQANYTFGKVLTDFGGGQSNFSGYMDNAQPQLEKMRPDFDITHTFNLNFNCNLPFGDQERFGISNKWLNYVVGGWNLGAIVRLHSGEVINIVSQRATINRFGRSGKNTVDLLGLTIPELQDKTGVYHDSQGRIVMFDPSLIGPDGRGSSTYFANPDVATAGSLGLSPVSGPWYFNNDLRLRKQFKLNTVREGSTLEVRADFTNVFNRTNFNITGTPNGQDETVSVYNGQSINSTSFGLINDSFSPRKVEVGLKLSF
jgi:hypothetical protein